MKTLLGGIAAVLGVALLVNPAKAGIITINFDDLAQTGPPAGSTVIPVNTQYSVTDGVTFSTTLNHIVMILSGTLYNTSSVPNVICTATSSGGIDCTQDLTLLFSTPVDNLSFDAFGNDSTSNGGTFAFADIYQGGVDTHPNIPLLVSQGGTSVGGFFGINPDHQTLNFTGITQLVIHGNTDVNGTAYDNFSFSIADSTTVPEPSTMVLMGLFGIAVAGRRFLAKKA